jgi:hypothetical protein
MNEISVEASLGNENKSHCVAAAVLKRLAPKLQWIFIMLCESCF